MLFCRSLWKHFRAVSLCLFLLVFPAYMAYMICQFFHMDFWLLIIISSSILTSLQVRTSALWSPALTVILLLKGGKYMMRKEQGWEKSRITRGDKKSFSVSSIWGWGAPGWAENRGEQKSTWNFKAQRLLRVCNYHSKKFFSQSTHLCVIN